MRINPALTIEDFGDEVIIVNLYNGAYYSMKGPAAVVWKNLQQSSDLPQLMELLAATHDLNEDALRDIRQFLDQCAEDELLLFEDGLSGFFDSLEVKANGGGPLERPQYDKFTNMQDILLLDPIHDVGELGWPHPKA